jgi:molybdenum cofactor cytidylyltransferase
VIYAVVPAAGRSTRMGRPKLSLPIAGRPMLEHVLAALRGGGIQHIVVVIGPANRELVAIAEAAGIDHCLLSEDTPDMRTTVELGLQHLEAKHNPAAADGFALVPADHPAMTASVVHTLCEAFDRSTRSIVVPVHSGRRGHPVMIRWAHVAALRAWPHAKGIDSYLRTQLHDTDEIAIEDPGVLVDLDTPADLAACAIPVRVPPLRF